MTREIPTIDGLPKLNPDTKAAWITALRSGEYKQGLGNLRTMSDRMCCLGVLCDLHQKATHQFEWEAGAIFYNYDGVSCYPPAELMPWAGIDYSDARTTYEAQSQFLEKLGIDKANSGTVEYVLAYLNDSLDYSFDDIANFIEKNM